MSAEGDRLCSLGMIDRNGDALVEHITETVPQSSLNMFILSVGDDPAVQLRNIRKTFAEHECRQFLAPHSARTIGEDGLVLLIAEILTDPLRKIAEGLDGRADGIPEMTEIIFIIGPTVEDQHIVPLHHLVPLFGGEISSGLFERTAALARAERNKFFLRADE